MKMVSIGYCPLCAVWKRCLQGIVGFVFRTLPSYRSQVTGESKLEKKVGTRETRDEQLSPPPFFFFSFFSFSLSFSCFFFFFLFCFAAITSHQHVVGVWSLVNQKENHLLKRGSLWPIDYFSVPGASSASRGDVWGPMAFLLHGAGAALSDISCFVSGKYVAIVRFHTTRR